MNLDALGFSQYLPAAKAEKTTESQKVCFHTLGNMLDLTSEACKELEIYGIEAGTVNMIFAKSKDKEILRDIAKNYEFVITLKDNVVSGEFGSAILEF
jgi:1-deoxy-D-xylulose-5-phosphate synthase